jgi:hypothetical protein
MLTGSPGPVTIKPRIHHRYGIDTADHPRRPHFLAESVHKVRILGKLGMDNLHRHRPTIRRETQVNPAHPASTQPGIQLVWPDLAGIILRKRLHRASAPSAAYVRH